MADEQEDLAALKEGDWLGDIDMQAWNALVERRGGCRCHLSPPCNVCTDPPTEEELNAVGFTYGESA